MAIEPRSTSTTFYYERLRAVSAGIIETASTTFLLLIAVRWYEAGATYKSIIAAGTSFGFLLSPFVVHMVEKLELPVARAASYLALISACGFLIATIFPHIATFAGGSLIGVACLSSCVPLFTQLYQDNYPEELRGRLFSRSVMIRIAIAVIFNDLAGRALTGRIEYFQYLMFVFFLASTFSAYCLYHCPSHPIFKKSKRSPLGALSYLKTDRIFRYTLICWMLMGFANLMMLPLRVEYLANPKYGMNLTVGEIALLTGVIPNAARFVLSPVWGTLFDRMNFFLLRIILNMGFAAGILTFFTSDDWTGLILGAITFGIANAGGDIAWSLWVTKFAPQERVADYMSIHSFFTGIRGVCAPFFAFYLAQSFELTTLGIISAVMIIAANMMLFPEFKAEKHRRKSFTGVARNLE